MLGTILLVLLIVWVVGALPVYPHSRSWGYAPSLIGVVLLVLLVLWLFGGLGHHTLRI